MEEDLAKLFPDIASAEHPLERPFECSECKKEVSVVYTEVSMNGVSHLAMCQDCPQLKMRTVGAACGLEAELGVGEGLCCGSCGTSISAVRTGNLLGCGECYELFGDLVVQELMSEERVPERFKENKSTGPLHLGKTPEGPVGVSPSSKLVALNEALGEMLKKEDYEQAAQLRDEIKKLTEQADEQPK